MVGNLVCMWKRKRDPSQRRRVVSVLKTNERPPVPSYANAPEQKQKTQVFLCLLVVWNVGIISTSEALSGFNNPGVLAIGGLFVVVSSIESSRLADKAAKRVFGLTSSFTSGFLRLLLCAVCMSAFCNNTPILALLIPVAKDWARTRGYDHAVLLMPLAFACAFGGLLTTVGGGTNLVIQGLLYEAEKEDETVGPFRLFEPGYVGLPLTVAGLGYLLVAAPRLLAAAPPVGAGGGGAVPGLRDRSRELLTEVRCRGVCGGAVRSAPGFDVCTNGFAPILCGLFTMHTGGAWVGRFRVCGEAIQYTHVHAALKQ